MELHAETIFTCAESIPLKPNFVELVVFINQFVEIRKRFQLDGFLAMRSIGPGKLKGSPKSYR